MRELLGLPGARLFQYELADGTRCNLDQRKLNEYVKTHLGDDYTAKDFRTWGGTLLAAIELAQHEPPGESHRREAANCGGDASRRREARKHAGGRTLVVRQPGGGRAVSRRENDRGFPAAAFARRRRPGSRPRPRGAGDIEPVAIVANSLFARRCVNCREWHGKPFSFATTAARKSTSRAARRCASPTSMPAAARRSPISATTARARCRAAPPLAGAGGRRPQPRANRLTRLFAPFSDA